MGARKIAKWLGYGVVGLTLLAVAGQAGPVRAQGVAPGQALVVVYNASSLAIDVDLVTGTRHQSLARELWPDEAQPLMAAPAGAATLEVRTADQGFNRQARLKVRLRAGKAYCVFVAGREPVHVVDLTRRLRVDPSPAKLCREAAQGR